MKPRPEDQNLHPDQWDRLNQEFYQADPEAYFLRRLRSLILAVVDAPAVREAQRQRIELGRLSMPPEVPYDPDQAAMYGAIESTNLLHHVAETIMRLYFAHERRPDCPWLEVARLRFELANRLESLQKSLAQPDVVQRLLQVFRGATSAAEMDRHGDISEEKWQEYTEGLVALVDRLCTMLLRETTAYNATKHGLGVVSSPRGMSLTSVVGPEFGATSQGPTIAFLEQGLKRGRPVWNQVYDPVSVESNAAFTEFLIGQLRGLWSVARAQYGYPSDGAPGYVTHFPAWWIDRLETLGWDASQGVVIGRASHSLIYLDQPLRPPDVEP